MTPFAIFAFVLTFGYFIYFAVMITLDLHAKPANGQKNEEEDIEYLLSVGAVNFSRDKESANGFECVFHLAVAVNEEFARVFTFVDER